MGFAISLVFRTVWRGWKYRLPAWLRWIKKKYGPVPLIMIAVSILSLLIFFKWRKARRQARLEQSIKVHYPEWSQESYRELIHESLPSQSTKETKNLESPAAKSEQNVAE